MWSSGRDERYAVGRPGPAGSHDRGRGADHGGRTRIQKAQRLMAENKVQAIVLDSGTSMVYFTGIGWGASERPMLAIIPAQGEVKYVSPAFEAERLRELIKIGNEVRVWEEDESPYKVAAGILNKEGSVSA